MIIVSNTSPFIGLLKIGQVDLLPRLYGSISIPLEVAEELALPQTTAGSSNVH